MFVVFLDSKYRYFLLRLATIPTNVKLLVSTVMHQHTLDMSRYPAGSADVLLARSNLLRGAPQPHRHRRYHVSARVHNYGRAGECEFSFYDQH